MTPARSPTRRRGGQTASRYRRFREWLTGRTEQERAWPRRLKRLVIVGVPAGFLLMVLFFAAAYAFVRIPEPNDIASAHTTIVLDRHGRVIARLHAGADRVDVPFADMPAHLRRAVITAEDRNFYTHSGVSLPSIVRAAVANITGGGIKQGGSTITQQYVKNAFVGRERTLWRKVKEAVVSMKIERQRSKDEILEAYLNTIYFGRGAYGVEAAARTYFGIGAKSLSLDQSALLAGILRAPERYDPIRQPATAKARRDAILDTMARLGAIDQAAAVEAKDKPLGVRSRASVDGPAPIGAHFVEEVRRELLRRFGSDAVYRDGLVVRTTLDLTLQRHAEDAVATVLDRKDDPQAALVAIDNDTGAVLSMVGGRTFEETQFNLATQGRRQPGSAFKPFVLAAAIEDAISVRSRFKAPAQITLETGFEPWKVSNYDRRNYGTIDLLEATESSVNTVYAQLILKVGPKRAADIAQRMGITSKLSAVPSLTLGTSVVSPLELTGAFAGFATGGMHATPYLITSVSDADKNVIEKTEVKALRVVDSTIAATVAHALVQVVDRGTGRVADLGGRPVGGKTGTTEDHVDAWFVGFTRQISTGVWMGYPEGGRTMERVRGVAVTGGSFPARIWRAFMERAVEGLPSEGFGKPSFEGEILNASPTPTPTPTASTTVLPTLPPSVEPTPRRTNTPGPDPSPSPTPTPTPTGQASGGGGGGG